MPRRDGKAQAVRDRQAPPAEDLTRHQVRLELIKRLAKLDKDYNFWSIVGLDYQEHEPVTSITARPKEPDDVVRSPAQPPVQETWRGRRQSGG
jgi:hypothetical protein